jgi:methanogenic corrinoid protein MtbC1
VPHGNDDEALSRELEVAAQFERMYADALLAGVPSDAEEVIREAVDAGLGEAVIDDHVIRPALQLVGDLWEAGEITVAEEHMATSISMRVVTLQREMFRLARQRTSHSVLLAAAEGEQHVVGLEMAASLILHAGYEVRFYGANLPVAEIARLVDVHRPAVVGFTTATRFTAERLPDAFAAVHGTDRGVGIVVGGLGAEGSWTAGWDVAVCDHATDAVAHVDALVRRAAHN